MVDERQLQVLNGDTVFPVGQRRLDEIVGEHLGEALEPRKQPRRQATLLVRRARHVHETRIAEERDPAHHFRVRLEQGADQSVPRIAE